MAEDHEAQAKEMGWVPEAEFQGDKARWVDAETFLERGRTYIPFLKKELAATKAEMARLESLVLEGRTAMEEFKKYAQEDKVKAVSAAKEELKRQLLEARQEGDINAEVDIQDKIRELPTEKELRQEAASAQKDMSNPANWDPVYREWVAENPWINDPKLSAKAQYEASLLRLTDEGKLLSGRKFLDAVAKRVNDSTPNPRNAPDAVEGAKNGASSGGKKSYNSLPADAKAACDRWADKLVGPGKTYKTVAEWREKYVSDYEWS
jgi:hypothetical protein